MSCGQSSLSPYPQKWFRKYEPSPIIDGVVYEIGVLKDYPPLDGLGGRRVYTLLANTEIGVLNDIEDPMTQLGALITLETLNLAGLWTPTNSSYNWGSCGDSQYESCSLVTQSTLNTLTYARADAAQTGLYGPYIFISGSAISGSPLPTTTTPTAYAPPCPIGSSAPSVTNSLKMNGSVLLRAWMCLNTSSKLYYVRYSALDSSTNSYTIAAAGLGRVNSSNGNAYWDFVYNLPSSASKGSTDIYYYIYELDAPYS